MKGKTPKLPHPDEWDFRRVCPLAMPHAVVWEYSRTHDGIRERVKDWLRTEVDGDKLGNHLVAACRKIKPHQRSLDAMGLVSNNVHDLVMRGWTEGIVPIPLWEIIYGIRPDFPNAWLSLPMEWSKNERYRRATLKPITHTIQTVLEIRKIRGAEHGDSVGLNNFKSGSDFHLKVNWEGSTIDDIMDEIREVLEGEKTKQPSAPKRGRPAASPADRLKWLATLRLKRSGFTFDEANLALEPYYSATDESSKILPKYQYEKGWNEAIRRAEAELEKLA